MTKNKRLMKDFHHFRLAWAFEVCRVINYKIKTTKFSIFQLSTTKTRLKFPTTTTQKLTDLVTLADLFCTLCQKDLLHEDFLSVSLLIMRTYLYFRRCPRHPHASQEDPHRSERFLFRSHATRRRHPPHLRLCFRKELGSPGARKREQRIVVARRPSTRHHL